MFLKESDDIELLVTYLSDNTFNLYSFMYARRINEAWKKCANGVIAPVLLFFTFNFLEFIGLCNRYN